MPVQLLADAAQVGVGEFAIEHRRDFRRGEIGVADDRVRTPIHVGNRLHPGHLVHFPAWRHVRLHEHRFHHAVRLGFAAELSGRIIAAQRAVLAENPRHGRAREPRQISEAPDMVMRVDDGRHCASSNTTSSDSIDSITASNAATVLIICAIGIG